MCERFALHSDMALIRARFSVRTKACSEWTPRWNLERGDEAPVIRRSENGRREIALLKWGLELDHPVLNVSERPATCIAARSLKRGALLKSLFESKRCILPLDAFYVTSPFAPKARPWAFSLDEAETMGIAAIWLPNPRENGLGSFALISTSPNESIALLSDAMPAILFPEHEREWLSAGTSSRAAYNLIKPYPADLMRAWPVAHVKGDGPNLLARVA